MASQRCLRAHCVIVSSGRENKIGKEINKRVDQRGAIRLTPSERSTTTWLAGPGEVVIAAGGVLISSPGTRQPGSGIRSRKDGILASAGLEETVQVEAQYPVCINRHTIDNGSHNPRPRPAPAPAAGAGYNYHR